MPPIAKDARKNPGFRFDGSGKSFQTESVERHVDVCTCTGRQNLGVEDHDCSFGGTCVDDLHPDKLGISS